MFSIWHYRLKKNKDFCEALRNRELLSTQLRTESAFIFSLFIGIAVFMELGNLLFFQKDLSSFWQKLPIQFQIQTVLLWLTLLMFFIIAATTFYFLHENNLAVSYERQLYISETLRKEIIEEAEQNDWGLADFKVGLLADR